MSEINKLNFWNSGSDLEINNYDTKLTFQEFPNHFQLLQDKLFHMLSLSLLDQDIDTLEMKVEPQLLSCYKYEDKISWSLKTQPQILSSEERQIFLTKKKN